MNCPSRNDDPIDPTWNQSPQALNSDLTTRADFNGRVNLRDREDDRIPDTSAEELDVQTSRDDDGDEGDRKRPHVVSGLSTTSTRYRRTVWTEQVRSAISARAGQAGTVLAKYAQFVGPGFMISVAYIDPGNYATDVAAGATSQYKLLFVVLLSNLIAIFLQSLCIKLGSVTGRDLAANCRQHLPRWLNLILYLLAESAIIATDIAEVIGSAIALNLLFHIPIVAGVAITIVDVLLMLLFWKPDGSMTRLRIFEYFVMALVLGVMICFCIQLSYIRNTSAGEVFRGYLPSSALVKGQGLYQSCGILGATVMPHSLFLGSGIVQPRLRQFDDAANLRPPPTTGSTTTTTTTSRGTDTSEKYQPSPRVIRSCLKYSIVELSTSLFTFALFVNSAILIVAGASLYGNPDASTASLFGIHDLLSSTLSPAAGTVFALALLLSGTSAGIVCTMAGQMVSEGMLHWTLPPWLRRLLTRTVAIIPSIVIAGAVGKEGLSKALNASQVVLSVILPFVAAPLVWFTCRAGVMTVSWRPGVVRDGDGGEGEGEGLGGEGEGEGGEGGGGGGVEEKVNMRNGWVVTAIAVVVWAVLVVMNGALIVLVGLGRA